MGKQLSNHKLALIFIGVGLLIIIIAVPMIYEAVPRNGFYGFRTEKTLSSDEIWYPANRKAGEALLVSGIITTLGCAALWLYAGRLSRSAVVALALALLLAPVAWAIYYSFNYLKTL